MRSRFSSIMQVSCVTRGTFRLCTVFHGFPAISAPCSFKNMSDQEWDQIMAVHLKGSYSCARAAWPIFQKQGFGRIVNTASAAGLYGLCHHPTCDVHTTLT